MNDELKNRLIKSIILNQIAIGSSFIIFLASCSVQKQIAKSASKDVLDAGPLQTAHVGISIYESATNKYWYDYQGDKYFVPASNIKIPTCYAAMKYLGDSLVGIRYKFLDNQFVLVQSTADPSFLVSEFKSQPVYEFLKSLDEKQIILTNPKWEEESLGLGWSWGDYMATYMVERSPMPIYGNVVKFKYTGKKFFALPKLFNIPNDIYDSHVVRTLDSIDNKFDIIRDRSENFFSLKKSEKAVDSIKIPFVTNRGIISSLLKDTLHKAIASDSDLWLDLTAPLIHSQPTDSILKPMMHRSDNFFAEQTLLMVSNERLGVMNDEKIIDTILKTDLKDLPQKPRWADGSGLSRYNLFTPQDLVSILNKMKNEFGMERVKAIFPTGGRGTLANYYRSDSNYIYAKTGTLSGVVALSGYLYTKKGKELIFSVLVNNHQASGTEVRRAVEKFLQSVRNKY